MTINNDMVGRLRDRAKFARDERTATADVDARYFEEAADEIERLTAAIGDAVVVPAGWQLVPVKPTREMTMHACTALPAVDGVFGHAGALSATVYTRMLEVAPTLAVPRHQCGGAVE